MSIWVAIHPRAGRTRVLATQGVKRTLLKAHLATSPAHPRALPTLLEALALWQGEPVRAVLVADGEATSSATSLFRDCFALADGAPLYRLDVAEHRPVRPREPAIDGMGDFRDLRQLLLWEVAR